MTWFRITLIAMTALIAAMTMGALAHDGINLISPFLRPVADLTWQGQFNIDFACYLVLSGIWMAWRSGFSGRSIALGVLAPPLGIAFLAPFLLWLTVTSHGDPRRILLGVHA
ncbi:hypothetical protein [uncultured Roseobacter sp.]|uniref:hypothetical protein n=1 Tax=uncultured Roseobacter sp. TaxID=114847 RepID=UPI0026092B75|nr:hypothetical protein [uncultured Roseobacter sp.]